MGCGMNLQDSVDSFYEIRYLNRETWRVISALTEEAGEVQGAYNKMHDGNKRKPKGEQDVVEELVQLTGCCFLAGRHYGLDVEEILYQVSCFLDEKREQFTGDRVSADR